ncbi:precorrin-6A/cobalt-precorrin-6A reductase [Amaricoccus macauensis]|uniref:Precorrin-6A/cobalt-precorrin-6A reductase n=1 Tax=Amaricoccus macauensis TaxID=57001 RepID=A0A840STQ6_9RHOB|nr:cobalt-precorrin-6A reductase [Amaricoccus macauensis]MBB5224028.1 precorrin-6A/cobalt-precorrin-6A reductase [Amaricoccus macauensis]
MHILILGGTGEARALAERLTGQRLAGQRLTYSLAGRTRAPVLPDCDVRVGGFGGAGGLAGWIAAEAVRVLVDATHPFARRISENALTAARVAGVPLVTLRRPGWKREAGDRWTGVPDLAAAADALGGVPKRVLLAIGRQEVGAFRAAPGHRYLVRSIEPPEAGALPDGAEVLLARGPFDEAAERAFLARHGIEVVVTKNSGGDATYGKIAAARALGIPVVMVERPAGPEAVETVEDALAAIGRHLAGPAERGE